MENKTTICISKNRKRKNRKILKRAVKKAERIEKQEEQKRLAELGGRFIEEDHHGGLYTPEFTIKAKDYWLGQLKDRIREDDSEFLLWFRKNRVSLQTLLLKWSDLVERGPEFWFVYELLGIYRNYYSSDPDNHKLLDSGSALRSYVRGFFRT